MKKFLPIFTGGLLLAVTMSLAAAAPPDLLVHVKPEVTVDRPVSPLLVSGFIELGFGRTENLLAEKLYDRGFELPDEFTFNRGWCAFCQPKPEMENWWHSGYEEHRWHLLKDAGDTNSTFRRIDGNWPAPPSGRFFAEIKNGSKTGAVSLAQDGIWIEAGVEHVFSGLLCDGTYFSAEPYAKHPEELAIALLPDGQPDAAPVSLARLRMNATTFHHFSVVLPAAAVSGRVTLAIRVPAGRKLGCDNLSLVPADNVDRVRRDVVAAFRAVPQGVIRFPGGCFASTYRWTDGVGDLDARPVGRDNWWDNPLINDFGTVEFLKFCRNVGSEPMICVPVMFGTAANAADWVAFCNKPGHRLHPGSGLDRPLPVKYWELDNETYRVMDAITYAHKCAEFSKAMKQADPAVQPIMDCYWAYHPKLREMLEIAGPWINLVNNRGGTIEELQGDLAELKRYNAAHHTDITLCRSEYRAYDYDLPTGKAAGGDAEGLNQPKSEDKDTPLAKAARWSYGLSVLSDFLDYQSFGGEFRFANFTESTDGWGENLINIAKTRTYPSAAGQALTFLHDQRMAWPVALTGLSLPSTWRVQAAWDAKKRNLIVFILNMSGQPKTLGLDLAGMKKKFAAEATGETLSAVSSKVFVTETGPNPITRAAFTVPVTAEGCAVPCPAWSVVAVRLGVK